MNNRDQLWYPMTRRALVSHLRLQAVWLTLCASRPVACVRGRFRGQMTLFPRDHIATCGSEHRWLIASHWGGVKYGLGSSFARENMYIIPSHDATTDERRMYVGEWIICVSDVQQ